MEGGDQAGGSAQLGLEGQGAGLPVDAGVVAGQPWEAEDEGEVGQRHQLQGDVLLMRAMDPDPGRKVVCDGGRRAAVDELDWDGVGVGLGLQEVDTTEGWIQEGAGGAGVDEGQNRARELAGKKDMNGERKVAGGGEGEGVGEGKYAAQPGPYWLGREFPGWLAARGVTCGWVDGGPPGGGM